MLEDVAVVVRDRDSHSALLLCRPRLGVGLRRGGIGDVAAGDDQAPAVDQRVGDLCTGAVADGRHRGAGDAHALGGRSLAQVLKIHEAQRLELVDRQRDVAPARRAIGGKPEVFGFCPDVSGLLPATRHAFCSLFLTYDRNKDTPMRQVCKSFLTYVDNWRPSALLASKSRCG